MYVSTHARVRLCLDLILITCLDRMLFRVTLREVRGHEGCDIRCRFNGTELKREKSALEQCSYIEGRSTGLNLKWVNILRLPLSNAAPLHGRTPTNLEAWNSLSRAVALTRSKYCLQRVDPVSDHGLHYTTLCLCVPQDHLDQRR